MLLGPLPTPGAKDVGSQLDDLGADSPALWAFPSLADAFDGFLTPLPSRSPSMLIGRPCGKGRFRWQHADGLVLGDSLRNDIDIHHFTDTIMCAKRAHHFSKSHTSL